MTDITIPPEALEDSAKKIAYELGYTWGAKGVDLDAFREAARAACLAMLKAWPGANWDEAHRIGIVLPLPKEPTDD